MPQAQLSNLSLSNIVPTGKPYFIRDMTLRGLGVKVTPSGKIKFVMEVWSCNSSTRKTIGEFPYMNVQETRVVSLSVISDIKAGECQKEPKEMSLNKLFKQYLSAGRLKPRTIVDCQEAIQLMLYTHLPAAQVTNVMERYYRFILKCIYCCRS